MADGSEGDTVDAKGIFGTMALKESRRRRKIVPKPVDPVTVRGTENSYEYAMDYGKRGLCIILNHKEFEPQTNLNVRNGTNADASRLYCRFTDLGFKVESYTDLTVREVKKVLEEAGKTDHSEYSCFVCCVLSHGDYGILYAKDGKYSTETIFAPFRGDVCRSLVGKPKMFFLQACQGDRLDPGVNAVCKESLDSDSQFRIPTHADFLIVYSTVPGFYSWRNTTNGSWFIQALCKALEEHAKHRDILQILTIVNRKVSFGFESYVPNDSSMHLKKQVPLVTSTLTRDLKFYP